MANDSSSDEEPPERQQVRHQQPSRQQQFGNRIQCLEILFESESFFLVGDMFWDLVYLL